MESLPNIFDELVQEDGCILKQTADYDVRAGVATKPIPTSDAISVQVLHALLRTFDLYMKVVIRCKAMILNLSVATTSRVMEFLKRAKSQMQEHIKTQLNIKWDFPDATGKGGTTTKREHCKRALVQQ